MIDIELLLCILLSALFIINCYFYYFHYREKKKLLSQVELLESQQLTLAKNIASFMISTNSRIADISIEFDCCVDNIDTLSDEKDKINESIADLKRSVECVDCKLQNPLTRFMK